MSAANWVEIAALLVLLAISTPLLGNYMAKVYGGGKAPGGRPLPPHRAGRLPHLRDRPRRRAALEHLRPVAAPLHAGGHRVHLRDPPDPGAPAAQPGPA